MQKYREPYRFRMLAFLLGMLLPMCMFAQTIKVQGVVKDSTGETVIGASVVEKGTTNGCITGIDGDFMLNVSANATIVISYVGYKTQEVPVDGRSMLTIVLQEDTEVMDEVVVIGYGTMKKSDLTGAVSSLGNKSIKDAPVANLGQAMQGKIAGVRIIDSGSPGSNVSIKVRGLGSINSCNPLVVIDGVPTDLGLNALNMADVERLDVLKDASATAIYGSRGAYGVVMITTKRGAEGKGKLSFSANYAVQNAVNVPDLLNAAQYAELSNDMMVNSGRNSNPEWANPLLLGEGTDWIGTLLGTGTMQNYTASYSGGGEKYNYYVSGGYMKQDGIVNNQGYRRYTFQSNSDAKVFNWLKFSNNITFSADQKDSGSYNIGDALKALPVQSIKDADGGWAGPEGNSEWYGSIRNPLGTTEMNKSKTNGYNLLANMTAELTFTKWLKFKSTLGYDAKFWYSKSFTPKYDWKPTPVEQSSRYQSSNKSFTYLWDNYFVFDHTFAEKHHLGIMVGTSAQWNEYDFMSGQKNVFLFDSVNQLGNGQEMYSIDGNQSDWSLLSYMARINYSYADRYLITATVRRDGSSRFGKNNRWGTFPSVSLAWRASEENWFPKSNWLNNLKIRAGYGITGSQDGVGNYSYLASFDTRLYSFGYVGKEQSALVAATLANPNIHWEEVAQTNIGFDASLFDSRATLSLDAYIKDTRNMLVKASIPITSGFEDTTTTYTNAGKVRNQGIEMSLNTINLKGELGWETAVSATWNKNKIKDLNSDVPFYINQINNSYVTMLAVDYPINVFYGYVTDGIFQNESQVQTHAFQAGAEAGDICFKDLNNDGVINDDDRTVLGNPNPTCLFSMNNNFTYKGFELSIYLQGVAGNKIFNANNIDLTGMSAAYNQTTDVLNRWTGEGTSNCMPRAVYGDPNGNNRVSDRFVENGSYLRLKNISLAYNFPKQWLNKLMIENARLLLSCENVATITGYSGFDPEVGENGIDSSRYPISRTFSVGLNFNF